VAVAEPTRLKIIRSGAAAQLLKSLLHVKGSFRGTSSSQDLPDVEVRRPKAKAKAGSGVLSYLLCYCQPHLARHFYQI
jgi:hypothetical protein